MNRTGSSSYASIGPDVLAAINAGRIDSATHVEQMAADFGQLLRTIEHDLAGEAWRFEGQRFLRRMQIGGEVLFGHRGRNAYLRPRSDYRDIPRGWQAFAIRADVEIGPTQAILAAQVYAEDTHFAVREWAWLSVRELIVDNPDESMAQLTILARSPSPRLRRFAVEACRPRSVWGKHFDRMKSNPELAGELMRSMSTEAEPSVVRSAANWLRDEVSYESDWVYELIRQLPSDSALGALWARRTRAKEVRLAIRHG